MLTQDRLRFLAVCILVALLVSIAAQVVTSRQGATPLTPAGLGADYPVFYAAGRIVLDHQADRLYDLDLQAQIGDDARPGAPPQGALPFAYPPFVAIPLVPLAALPYAWSFVVWVVLSVLLLVGALLLIRRACTAMEPEQRLTAAALALASFPVFDSLAGGQAGALAFAAIAAALVAVQNGRPVLAGIALAGLAYKPTLLVLFLPMLVLGRYWRSLAGLLAGGALLAGLSVAVVGPAGCLEWFRLITVYGRLTVGSEGARVFRLFKYVDIRSFTANLMGDQPYAGLIALVLAVPGIFLLVRAWVRRSAGQHDAELWAATATWTTVLNLYIATYDLTLAVPGVLISLNASASRGGEANGLARGDRILLMMAWVVPWVTQSFAIHFGIQPATATMAALGVWQLRIARRIG